MKIIITATTTTMRSFTLSLLFLLFCNQPVISFLSPSSPSSLISTLTTTTTAYRSLDHRYYTEGLKSSSSSDQEQQALDEDDEEEDQRVYLSCELTDEKVKELFAWVRCLLQGAANGQDAYNDLQLAMEAIFNKGMKEDTMPRQMVRDALDALPTIDEDGVVVDNIYEVLMGDALGRTQRESYSLGAMGAGQWSGQYQTRPHALLPLSNLTSVDDWIKTLPRGVKRTLKKAKAFHNTNFTVTAKPIIGGQAAPHSSIAHFRCVLEHEMRVIMAPIMKRRQEQKEMKNNNGESDDDEDEEEDDNIITNYDEYYSFVNAMSAAISRYIETTRMTGEIREYRAVDGDENRVIAFAHEVRKANTIRGQWFYATDEASKKYVWFHSVYSLVERAVQEDDITCVDLGPSGSDAFSQLKERYGFQSYVDWPSVANYIGPFYYGDDDDETNVDRENAMELLMKKLGIVFE